MIETSPRAPPEKMNARLGQAKYVPQPEDIVLEEGVDYFLTAEAAAAKREQLRKEFQSGVIAAHQQTVASGNQEDIQISQLLKDGVDVILSPNIQGDLEIMHLLETTRITDRRKAEIAALFAPPPDEATDELLNNVLNPHPIAIKLFGSRIQFLCNESPEYTEEYSCGNETIWSREKDYPSPELKNIPFTELAPLQLDHYATHMDEIFHTKLFRLADSFLNLNLASDSGILAFENFVHTYDISPGEYTLERCHTSPAPPHTFCELPIIKFDGYDEADVVPEGVVIPAKASHH